MPSAKTSYVGQLSGGVQKNPIPWDALVMTGTGATMPPAKKQYVQNVAQKTSLTAPPPGTANGYVPPAGTPDTSGVQGPAGTPAPGPDPMQHYRDAFDKYMETLQVSPEEKQARDYLNSLITQSRLDNEKALSSGETLGFATGEAARVGRNNQTAIDAAGRGLDSLTAYRGAATEGAKARADFEKTLLDQNKNQNDPFELSPGQERYQYNPATGKYDKVASVAPLPKEPTPKDPLDEEYKRAQIANIQSEINKRNKDSSASGQYTIPAASRNNLLKYGLKQGEVTALEQDIRLYGLAKALEGVDADTAGYITSELDKQYLAQ